MDVVVEEMIGPDLSKGFLETLANLSPVGLTPKEAVEIFRTRLHTGVRTFIARVDGQVVGTASLLIERKFIHKGGRVGHIEDVAVHKEFEGHGIGSALVRHALAEARKLRCYKVILDCFEDRVPFYERLGFHRHEVSMRVDM